MAYFYCDTCCPETCTAMPPMPPVPVQVQLQAAPHHMQELSKLGQSIGACNERIGSKARQLMSIVGSTTSDSDASNLQLEQARAALSIHLQGCQVFFCRCCVTTTQTEKHTPPHRIADVESAHR